MSTHDRSSNGTARTTTHESLDDDLVEAQKDPDYLKLLKQLDDTYNQKVEESELRRQHEVSSIRHWCRVERQEIHKTYNNAVKNERQRIKKEILEKIAYLEAEMEALKNSE
ncbi:hypothetical protein O0I10_010879 [Lichtheimia ornata]|uniref:Uncharacterized protein n=1 Tax=Lichtheimia ornata TaxID=688661 RepID=A0AAD7UUM1_9FUNG|nr:uncharacterized protein O0I10_010879 [Lichtheimia ornata]KAJ8653443.1 hypothetical protein O0I10_010879 [Lichtheimia ornata]